MDISPEIERLEDVKLIELKIKKLELQKLRNIQKIRQLRKKHQLRFLTSQVDKAIDLTTPQPSPQAHHFSSEPQYALLFEGLE